MTGVIIPKSALIWYMDQAFVYLKTAEETFNRRTLEHYSASADGYFIPDAIKPANSRTKGRKCCCQKSCAGRFPAKMTIEEREFMALCGIEGKYNGALRLRHVPTL